MFFHARIGKAANFSRELALSEPLASPKTNHWAPLRVGVAGFHVASFFLSSVPMRAASMCRDNRTADTARRRVCSSPAPDLRDYRKDS
jgi:hypothetical protein